MLRLMFVLFCFVLFYDHTLTPPNQWPHGYAFDIVQKPFTRQCALLIVKPVKQKSFRVILTLKMN